MSGSEMIEPQTPPAALQADQLTALRQQLTDELERLEQEERDEGNPISAPGVDSVREDRIAAIASQLAEVDAQLAQ